MILSIAYCALYFIPGRGSIPGHQPCYTLRGDYFGTSGKTAFSDNGFAFSLPYENYYDQRDDNPLEYI